MSEALLTNEHLAFIGAKAPEKREVVTRRDIRKYSVATKQSERRYLDGDEAPPLFHVALFWEIVELDELSADGVFIDKLIPKLPLERAMAGGVKIDYHRSIFPGDILIAQRRLSDIYEKRGSRGPIIFYETTTDIHTEAGEPVLSEYYTKLLM